MRDPENFFPGGGGGLKDIYVLRGGGVQGLFMVFLICGFNKFEFSRVGGGGGLPPPSLDPCMHICLY